MKLIFLILVFLYTFSCSKQSAEKLKEQEWHYLYDMGMSSYHARNYSEAIAYLYRASKINPKSPKVWNALGLTYMEVEEYEKAEKAFKKALEVDRNFSEAKMNLGILYARMKDYKSAIKYLQEAVNDETFPKKHIAFYHLAKVYKEFGNTEKYIALLKKATAYNPMFVVAQMELGNAYMDLKMYKEAENLYLNLISNNIKHPEIYLNLARIYYNTGNFEKAKDMIKVVLEDKQATNLQRNQAYSLLSKILIEEQRKEIEKLLALQSKHNKKSSESKEQDKKKQVGKQETEEENKNTYSIQIAAFSSEERASKLVNSLKERGLKDLKVVNVEGIYKVIYGSFNTREEAKRELEKLKEMEIFGFIVEGIR